MSTQKHALQLRLRGGINRTMSTIRRGCGVNTFRSSSETRVQAPHEPDGYAMSNVRHLTANVATMHARSALVHAARARAAAPLSPRPRHTSAAMPGCAQMAACG